jgi:methyl-accepting chemotaxis protein
MLSVSIKKVEGIINETKTKVEELVVVGKRKVDAGRTHAQKCSEVLEEIVQKVTIAKNMSTEISESCREQSQGVEQIEKAMTELEQVNNQNTTASQQCSASAEELASQAIKLDELIMVLVQTVEGYSSTKETHAASVHTLRSSKPAEGTSTQKKAS